MCNKGKQCLKIIICQNYLKTLLYECTMSEAQRNVFIKVYFDLQKFIFSNKIIVAAAGFSIAVATNDAVKKLLNSIIIPLFDFINNISLVRKALGVKIISIILGILGTLIMWMLTILLCFVLLEYFLNKSIFGMVTTISEDNKTEFVKAKVEAKRNDTISNKVENIKNEENKVNEILEMSKKDDKPVEDIIRQEMHDDLSKKTQQKQKQEEQRKQSQYWDDGSYMLV